MPRNVNYYRDGDTIIAVTDESPPNFKDVLFLGKTLIGDNVSESAWTPEQIKALEPIAKADLPAVSILAFGYEAPSEPKPAAPKRKPARAPETIKSTPRPRREPRTIKVDILFPWEAYGREARKHPPTPIPAELLPWLQLGTVILTGVILWYIRYGF